MDPIDWNSLNQNSVLFIVALHAVICGYLIINNDKNGGKQD